MSRHSEIMHAAVRIPNESTRIPKVNHINYTEQVNTYRIRYKKFDLKITLSIYTWDPEVEVEVMCIYPVTAVPHTRTHRRLSPDTVVHARYRFVSMRAGLVRLMPLVTLGIQSWA